MREWSSKAHSIRLYFMTEFGMRNGPELDARVKAVMGTTIDTSQAPSFFDMVEPEERKYWRPGYGKPYSINTDREPGAQITGGYTSEQAAIITKQKWAKMGWLWHGEPFEIDREGLIQIARSFGNHTVHIEDETGQVVETWSVQ